ncbi:MAG: hypothetical protein Fur003_4220 [Candidatus Dojkabacteria bacterium]
MGDTSKRRNNLQPPLFEVNSDADGPTYNYTDIALEKAENSPDLHQRLCNHFKDKPDAIEVITRFCNTLSPKYTAPVLGPLINDLNRVLIEEGSEKDKGARREFIVNELETLDIELLNEKYIKAELPLPDEILFEILTTEENALEKLDIVTKKRKENYLTLEDVSLSQRIKFDYGTGHYYLEAIDGYHIDIDKEDYEVVLFLQSLNELQARILNIFYPYSDRDTIFLSDESPYRSLYTTAINIIHKGYELYQGIGKKTLQEIRGNIGQFMSLNWKKRAAILLYDEAFNLDAPDGIMGMQRLYFIGNRLVTFRSFGNRDLDRFINYEDTTLTRDLAAEFGKLSEALFLNLFNKDTEERFNTLVQLLPKCEIARRYIQANIGVGNKITFSRDLRNELKEENSQIRDAIDEACTLLAEFRKKEPGRINILQKLIREDSGGDIGDYLRPLLKQLEDDPYKTGLPDLDTIKSYYYRNNFQQVVHFTYLLIKVLNLYHKHPLQGLGGRLIQNVKHNGEHNIESRFDGILFPNEIESDQIETVQRDNKVVVTIDKKGLPRANGYPVPIQIVEVKSLNSWLDILPPNVILKKHKDQIFSYVKALKHLSETEYDSQLVLNGVLVVYQCPVASRVFKMNLDGIMQSKDLPKDFENAKVEIVYDSFSDHTSPYLSNGFHG